MSPLTKRILDMRSLHSKIPIVFTDTTGRTDGLSLFRALFVFLFAQLYTLFPSIHLQITHDGSF